jgi:hypothetical protein
MPDIPGSETISTRQQTIATRARQAPELSFTSLNHYLDLDWLYEAYRRTRKDGAPSVDGQTAAAYAEQLEDNLRDLLDRAQSGRYRAPAVKRAYLPKGDGSAMRSIGVPTVSTYSGVAPDVFRFAGGHASIPPVEGPAAEHSVRAQASRRPPVRV